MHKKSCYSLNFHLEGAKNVCMVLNFYFFFYDEVNEYSTGRGIILKNIYIFNVF